MKKSADQKPGIPLFVYLLGIFLFWGLFNPLLSYSQQAGNITGKVLDANSSPLQGVTVKLKSRPQVASITDAEGKAKVILDQALWEEILSLLEDLEDTED